ncbi:MAG TPA: hypothetical protein VIJ82_03210 [Streptosporangiaceae bacterium]
MTWSSTRATLTVRPAASASRRCRAFLLVVLLASGSDGFFPRLRYSPKRVTRLTAA